MYHYTYMYICLFNYLSIHLLIYSFIHISYVLYIYIHMSFYVSNDIHPYITYLYVYYMYILYIYIHIYIYIHVYDIYIEWKIHEDYHRWSFFVLGFSQVLMKPLPFHGIPGQNWGRYSLVTLMNWYSSSGTPWLIVVI